MGKVNLISADFIREITNISNNTQDKFMKSAIRESQDIDLTEVLGSVMVEKLCKLVGEDKIGLEENIEYKQLLDKSQYFMAYSVITKLCLISSVKIDNIGLNLTNDENANQLYLTDVFKLESHYKNKADYYKERLQAYCKSKLNVLPELKEGGCWDVKAELNSAASCPIFLGGARGRKKKYN